MAAHPIAEASITLYLALSLSLCLTEGSQLGRAAANQEAETESEGGAGGGGCPPPPPAPRMPCKCCKQTDRVIEGLTHIWTSVLRRTLAVILWSPTRTCSPTRGHGGGKPQRREHFCWQSIIQAAA